MRTGNEAGLWGAPALRCMLALSILTLPSVAFAHPLVDEASRLYEEAEFAAASAQLDAAEASDSLERVDLVRVLELRMYLHLAGGSQSALRDDLIRLLSVDEDYQVGEEAPPEVEQMLTDLRSAGGASIEVRARPTPIATGVQVDARVERDPGDLTREVRVHARVGSSEPQSATATLRVAVGSDEQIAFWAEAVGPGGVVLAQHGASDAPLLFPQGATSTTIDSGDDSTAWIIVGVVAGILVAGGVVTGVVVATSPSGPSDQTQPSLPMISFP